MNCLALVILSALCVFVYSRPDDRYTTKYDNINLDQIIKNDRLMKNYVHCLLGKGRCNNEGEELKRLLPDAIHDNCSKCTETQRNGAKKLVHHLIENKRSWWDELEAKYDPEGIYKNKYQEEIKKEGLDI